MANKLLGKKEAKYDKRTLSFGKYTTKLAAPPSYKSWQDNITDWGMLGNDKCGDCTIAGMLHQIQLWTTNTGNIFTPTDAQALSIYEEMSGYNPTTGANDTGLVLLDVLNKWRKTGFVNHKIDSYLSIEPTNYTQLKQGIDLFGGCYIGLQLPISAQTQNYWHVPQGGPVGDGAPGSWGGHCVQVFDYQHDGLYVVTWGEMFFLTWYFWTTYCDEAYVMLSPDWLKNNAAPSGFDLTQLQADLALL